MRLCCRCRLAWKPVGVLVHVSMWAIARNEPFFFRPAAFVEGLTQTGVAVFEGNMYYGLSEHQLMYRKRSFANAEKWWGIRQARSRLHIGEISVGLRGHAGFLNLWWIVESQKPRGPQAECV